MKPIENQEPRGRLHALPTGPAGAGGSPRMRNLAVTLLVIAPIIGIYLAMWKFWFTGDFLTSLAAAATQSTASGSALGLFEVVKPSDQLGLVSTKYFFGIPIYNTVVGSLIPYHAISFFYIGILGVATWGRLTFNLHLRKILSRLWVFFGATWLAIFAAAQFSSGSIDALITIGLLANIILAGFTACFLLYSLVKKLRGGETKT